MNTYANTLQVGEKLPAIELNSQHDKPIKVAADIKTVIFTKDKKAGKLINTFLAKQDASFLKDNKICFIANISGMPKMISRVFAIPKMRKLPYDVLLARNKTDVAFMPYKKSFVSLVKIKGGAISSIEFIDNADELTEALK